MYYNYILTILFIYAAIWPQRIWAENWGAVPFWGIGAGSSSNIMWSGPRPTCMPSFILIRQTVWPQYTPTSQADRQDRQRSDRANRFTDGHPKIRENLLNSRATPVFAVPVAILGCVGPTVNFDTIVYGFER